VVLTPGYSGKSEREFWRIWIDFNGDNDFEDAGEQVFVANNKKDVVSGTIDIPSGVSGQTRMRVSIKNGSSPGSCEVFPFGEVEDYTANFMITKQESISRTYNRDLVIFPNPNNGSFQVLIGEDIRRSEFYIFYQLFDYFIICNFDLSYCSIANDTIFFIYCYVSQ